MRHPSAQRTSSSFEMLHTLVKAIIIFKVGELCIRGFVKGFESAWPTQGNHVGKLQCLEAAVKTVLISFLRRQNQNMQSHGSCNVCSFSAPPFSLKL
jgi:hypothetical protein